MTMFKALTDMLKTPVVIRPCINVNTVGDKTYGSDIQTKCCVEPRVTVLPTTRTGIQNISEGLMYISGDIDITDKDIIIFDGREYTVKRLWADYEGPDVSLWVVYF